MAPPVTELARLPLKPGSNITDPNTPEGTIWQDTLVTVLDQDGAQRAYWSLEHENPNVIRLAVDWVTLDHHKKFEKSPQYQPFVKNIMSIMDGPPSFYHAEFKPHPPSSGFGGNSAYPVTEVLTMFFPADHSQADQDKLPATLKSLLDKIGVGDRKFAIGWVVEDVDSDKVDGGKAKVCVACVPWASVKEHMETRETEAFKSNIHILKDTPGLKDVGFYHVKAETQQGQLGIEERGALSVQEGVQEEILNPQ